jgi:hypothetical protein
MARHKVGRAAKQTRVPGLFVALPHVVLESSAYRSLDFAARALLVDIAKQHKGRNNGSLVACSKYLAPMGWSSKQTVQRSIKALVAVKLLHLTRQGGINSASWYAVTWHDLDVLSGQDESAKSFQRSAFDDRISRPLITGLRIAQESGLPR